MELGWGRCQEKWVSALGWASGKLVVEFREGLISRVCQAYGVIPEIAKAFVCD